MGIKFVFLEMWQKNKNQDIVQQNLSISKMQIKVKVLTVGTIYTTRQEVVLFLFSVNS